MELNETERHRLKVLVETTMLMKEQDVSEFKRDCYNSSIVEAILDEDPDYQFPEDDVEELLPNLLKCSGWKGDTPQGIMENFGEQFQSSDELKESLSTEFGSSE